MRVRQPVVALRLPSAARPAAHAAAARAEPDSPVARAARRRRRRPAPAHPAAARHVAHAAAARAEPDAQPDHVPHAAVEDAPPPPTSLLPATLPPQPQYTRQARRLARHAHRGHVVGALPPPFSPPLAASPTQWPCAPSKTLVSRRAAACSTDTPPPPTSLLPATLPPQPQHARRARRLARHAHRAHVVSALPPLHTQLPAASLTYLAEVEAARPCMGGARLLPPRSEALQPPPCRGRRSPLSPSRRVARGQRRPSRPSHRRRSPRRPSPSRAAPDGRRVLHSICPRPPAHLHAYRPSSSTPPPARCRRARGPRLGASLTSRAPPSPAYSSSAPAPSH